MKEKVLELQQMLVDRIEAGEFEVVKVDFNGYVSISIDGYIFRFNQREQSIFDNFMQLPEISNTKHLIEAIDNDIKQAKIEALNKLQKEIQEL
jgi:hypothetical protein